MLVNPITRVTEGISMPKRPVSIIDRLPTLNEVDSAVARYAREANLLRTLRTALRRKRDHERAGDELRRYYQR
jgi:hypothetical protein